MKHFSWILIISTLVTGCHKATHLHHSQTLSKEELREHLRPYVNNPNYLFGKASLPGKVSYLDLNKHGITIVERGHELKMILPTDLFFERNSYELQENQLSALNLLVTIAKSTKTAPIVITGHTDTIGTKQHKALLSKQLSESIKNYLWKKGISQNRLLTYGQSDHKPVSDNTVRGRALNRRVEIQMRLKK